jgi:hypothetical protein
MMQEGTQAGDEPGNRGAPERVGLLDGGAAYLTTDFWLFRACLVATASAGYCGRFPQPGRRRNGKCATRADGFS